MWEEMSIVLKTPKELKDKVPRGKKRSIGIDITFKEDCTEIGYFIKKCLEDGFRENGTSAVISFRPEGIIKRIYV